MNLSVSLPLRQGGQLTLRNPVMTASGTFGYGTEYAKLVDVERLGAVVSKATTLRPREGNPQPRIAETPSGMLNTIGLQNIGVRALVKEKAPIWARWSVPVIVNVAGESVDEYARIAEILEGTPGVAGLELNISCPNVSAGKIPFGVDKNAAAAVTAAVRSVSSLPIITKLTPNVTDVVEIAEAVVDAGADAVSLINTLLGMAIDVRTRRPVLSTVTGGLSGPAVRPVALRMVYQVAKAVEVPVIGIGGISCAEDALQFLMAGATAVEVGTASFANPMAAIEIVDGLERFMLQEGVDDISEIIGVAQ
ncbi:MAG: dihydroorotate dehydrogenase [Dehalococcoidales bacterium]|nr:dihydroorotate dehydrogenase [Dehalococcoidales bacterium]